jgi:hypothetical protein
MSNINLNESAIVLLAHAFSHAILFLYPTVAQAKAPIVLTPEPGTMVVHADVPLLGDERFSAVLPKVLGDRDHVYLNEPQSCSVRWKGPDENGSCRVSSAPGTSLDFEIVLTPFNDRVELEYRVTNHAPTPLRGVWMMTYFAPRDPSWVENLGAGGGVLDRMSFQGTDGPIALSAAHRPVGNRPELLAFPRAGAPAAPHFLRTTAPLSSTKSYGDWMRLARPDGSAVTVTCTPSAFLFTNVRNGSLHVAPSFGTVKPGASVTARGTWRFTAPIIGAVEAEQAPLQMQSGKKHISR